MEKHRNQRIAVVGSLLCLALVLAGCGNEGRTQAGLIPAPSKTAVHRGSFQLTNNTLILTDSTFTEPAKLLADRLRTATGLTFETRAPTDSMAGDGSKAAFRLVKDAALDPEAYRLEVAPRSVSIHAHAAAGAFYGIQTLLQLMPPEVYAHTNFPARRSWSIRCASITDSPRFPWRGFMLDVARHFFTMSEVQQTLDALAMHKLNRFHFHVTDDQGWRLQITNYPRLTEVGAWRKHIGFRLPPDSSKTYGPDGRYGGFYSQEQIHELVAYAARRQITVVPEIEMPGHASAALAAYPELSCFGGPYSTDMDAGVFDGVFCAGNDQTFEFLENVLTEVMRLFPGKYIHAGGDEVPKDNWEKCPRCQERIRREGLRNEEELQAWFMRRIATFLANHGRTMIGWSEVADNEIPPGVVIMDWVGGGLEAARQGHDVVMTPTRFTYLDYYQSTNRPQEPRASGGFVPLEKAYAFNPVPKKLDPRFHRHILGLQGNLWTEFIPSLDHAEYMAFPRLAALAEVGWSSRRNRDYESFSKRLAVHLRRLEAKGINYRPLGP